MASDGKPAGKSSFFGAIGKGLQAAGAKTKKYGKLGLAKGELETEKVALRRAYKELGEEVFAAWAAEPGSLLDEENFEKYMECVKGLKLKCAELQARMSQIREKE